MKIRVVSLLLCLAVVLSPTQAVLIAKSASSAPVLKGKISYWWVGYQNIRDEEGRRLIWEGTIEGDLTGTMLWWFGRSPVRGGVDYTGGRVSFYAGRWEIWDEDREELLLAGESAGKTVTPSDADGMWDGHGVVTEAGKELNRLKGRKVYETGPVIREELPPGSELPFSITGTGMFLIY